jgi:hypothetical protein
MNPLEVEKGVTAYLRSLESLPANVQIHEAVTADEINLEQQAVVVEITDSEHRGPGLFLATLQVSLRSPSLAVTRADHSGLLDTLIAALQDQSDFATAFDAAAEGVTFHGCYLTSVPGPSFEDRAWINSLQLSLGLAV